MTFSFFSPSYQSYLHSVVFSTTPELETLLSTKPQRFVRSLRDAAVMQQNESSVCCSPETLCTAQGVLNKSRAEINSLLFGI